jgi:rubrerythrin
MGVRDHLSIFADGGKQGVHYECRDCGTNLTRDHETCPDCDGAVARYDL